LAAAELTLSDVDHDEYFVNLTYTLGRPA